MAMLPTKLALLMASTLTMGLSLSACSQSEKAEHMHTEETEEIAAQQGEMARAKNPEPQSKEKATPIEKFKAPAASSAPAATLASTGAGAGDAGEKLFGSVCKTCHEAGLMGAPKFGDKGLWAPRIGKGIDTLHQHALHGFNAMPAKGGNTDLLDVEVTNAVDYMVANGR